MILEKNIKRDILPGKSDHSLEQTPDPTKVVWVHAAEEPPAVINSPKHTT